MTDSPPLTDQARLAADWATILQSEAAALAVDREAHEALQRAAAHLAREAMAFGAAAHDPARRPAPDAAAGTEALADAPVTLPTHPAAGPGHQLAGLG